MAQTGYLGIEAGAAFLKGVVDENTCPYLERGEAQIASTYRSASHSEDRVDTDSSHERALAGHVGATDEKDPGFATDTDVVANAFCDCDEWMAELFGDEAGTAFDKFGKGIGRMLVAIAGEGKESFGVTNCLQPGADRESVGAAPSLCRVGNLNCVQERNIEAAHNGIFEREIGRASCRERVSPRV